MSTFYINKEKPINEVKIASGKTETKQINLQFTRKDIGLLHNSAR